MKPSALPRHPAVRFQLLLRIKHPTLDPAEITRRLNIEPEHTANVGSALSTSGKQQVRSESYWLATLPTPSVQDMVARAKLFGLTVGASQKPPAIRYAQLARSVGIYDVHLVLWLDTLAAHAEFIEEITDQGGSVTLVLQRTRNSPATITPAVGRRLADLGIDLEVD